MTNATINNAIRDCRNILIKEMQAELERRKEPITTDIHLGPTVTIRTICLYGGRPLVQYTDPYGEDADDIELFTLDEIIIIIDAL